MEEHQREVPAGGLTLIAEAATCHGGYLQDALRMVQAAKTAGATHVKFQHVDPRAVKDEWYLQARLHPYQLRCIKSFCDHVGIKFLCTPQTVGDFRDLVSIGIEEVKISSDNLTNIELLREVRAWGGHVYLSTGMASLTEIEAAWMEVENYDFMVCTSEYPCPMGRANLMRIKDSEDQLVAMTGFSDHTRGSTAALVALGLGARIFEKHFYLEEAGFGPDANPAFAMTEKELKVYFSALKRGYKAIGHGRWEPTPESLRAKESA